jgi:hypothetical protein
MKRKFSTRKGGISAKGESVSARRNLRTRGGKAIRNIAISVQNQILIKLFVHRGHPYFL